MPSLHQIQTKAAEWLLSLPVCRLLRPTGRISKANAQAAGSDAARDKPVSQCPTPSRDISPLERWEAREQLGGFDELAEYAARDAKNKGGFK